MVELGLNDGRKRKRNNPSDLWVLLGELAVSEGVLNWGNADKRKKVLSAPKQVERLGKKLKAFFGISQPPFDHYKKRHEYRSRFAISLDSNYRRHLESRAEVKDEPMFKEEYRDDRGQALDPDE